jgi:hypothetical protein
MNTKKKQTGQKSAKKTDYDSPLKDIIEGHFESFLELLFPDIHRDIDFSRGCRFLSKELRKITPDSKVGKRYADVLVKVYLKDGSEKYICIFIHIEVQRTRDPHFMLRVFVYYYRIFDKFWEKGSEVISLVILIDEDENYRPDEYSSGRWGFEHRLKVPVVKIIDFKNKKELRERLENTKNPMAILVRALLKSYEAKKVDNEKKYNIKFELIRQCYALGYSKDKTRSFLNFVDYLIHLPEYLEKRLSEEIIKIEEENKMPYVASWERIAKKEGERIGEKRGEKRGEIKGKLETARELVKNGVDIDIIARATGFSMEEIEKLAESIH